MKSNHDTLNQMYAMVDYLDDTCKILTDMLNIIDHYDKKFKPFENTSMLQDLIKKQLANLPPERVAILMKAMDDLGKLVPTSDSMNAKEEVEKIKSLLDSLTKIRSNIHFAVYGVLQ